MNEELEVASDPLLTLERWHAAARAHGAVEPDAMTLATATKEGRPAARVVLFKGLADGKIEFVTNYKSRKARELDDNPSVALVFFWIEIQRQIRVEGRAARGQASESDRYFRTRSRESQLAAWASDQSEIIETPFELELRYRALEERFALGPVERPPHWGLYDVYAESLEFWSSRPHRLHDRTRFRRTPSGWERDKLFP
jgi:pyridoxamine 5'-phosphate oxidase